MASKTVYTYADLESFPHDGKRREILDGELIVAPSPYTRHQELVLRLALVLGDHVKAHGGGRLFIAPLDVVFSDTNVTEPDLFFVADDRLGVVTEKNIRGAPSLAIEVVSDPRIDRVRKRDIYSRYGVPEYWEVDPDVDRVEVHRLDGDRYPRPELLEVGDVLTYEPLPGLRIDLAELFAR